MTSRRKFRRQVLLAAALAMAAFASSPARADRCDDVAKQLASQIDGIKALGAPTGDEAQVTAIVDSAQSALDKAKADPTTLLQNNPKNDPFAKANQLTKAYGLTACGGGG